ncbi:caspase domain-containing protein [Streptomyces sp. CBMA152]|uniref:caspase family protein n=1 Tax=Streptomyces sp. CBMA152 TaxID=1896312 RepID=UPI001660A954|nr:caspase family protein [Streptomyces sp. CBMA152]
MSEHRTGLDGSHALLLGASAFKHPDILPVPAAANSLRAMEAMLTDPALGGWPSAQVTSDQPPNAVDAVRRIRRLAQQTTGTLLLYYVGHGHISSSGELILTVHDTDPQDADLTGIEYSRVKSAILSSPASIKIVILDCCYSGRAIEALGSGTVGNAVTARGVYTLTAADLEVAHVPPLAEQSAVPTSFTGQLLELVRTGLPGESPWLTLDTIYPHLAARLRHAGLPAPNRLITDSASYFPFVRNTDRTGAARRSANTSAEPSATASPTTPSGRPHFDPVKGAGYDIEQVDAYRLDVIALVADPRRRRRARAPYFSQVSGKNRYGFDKAQVDAHIEQHRCEPASFVDALRMLLADSGIPLVPEGGAQTRKVAKQIDKVKSKCAIYGDEQLIGFVNVGWYGRTSGVIAFTDTRITIRTHFIPLSIPYSRVEQVHRTTDSTWESWGAGDAVGANQVITMTVRFGGREVKIEECNQHPLQNTLTDTLPALSKLRKNHPEWFVSGLTADSADRGEG